MKNLLTDIPAALNEEQVDVLAEGSSVRVERIISTGHTTRPDFWYDQKEHEWVTVLQGEAILEFEDGEKVAMVSGDQVLIPAGRKHRVAWTSQDTPTVWLAVFYPPESE